MFEGFEKHTRHVNGIDIHYRLGGSGPAFLSTHPQAADRVSDLQKFSAIVMPLYEQSPKI